MNTISMGLANIASKPCKEQISNAAGLLIISPQSFANFMADSTYTKHIHIAIASGVEAAKRTSEIFTLCYQIALQSIDIEIQPTDSIFTIHCNIIQIFSQALSPNAFLLKKIKRHKKPNQYKITQNLICV